MSIRPIDFHVTLANTVNESRVKQNDLNRNKEMVNIAEHQQQVDLEKNKKRVANTEAAQEKKVKPEDKNNQPSWDQSKKKRKEDDDKEETSCKKGETKGIKIDVMI